MAANLTRQLQTWRRLQQVAEWQLEAKQADLVQCQQHERALLLQQQALLAAPGQAAAQAGDPQWREQLASFAEVTMQQVADLQKPVQEAYAATETARTTVLQAHQRKRSIEAVAQRKALAVRRAALQAEDDARLEWALRRMHTPGSTGGSVLPHQTGMT